VYRTVVAASFINGSVKRPLPTGPALDFIWRHISCERRGRLGTWAGATGGVVCWGEGAGGGGLFAAGTRIMPGATAAAWPGLPRTITRATVLLLLYVIMKLVPRSTCRTTFMTGPL